MITALNVEVQKFNEAHCSTEIAKTQLTFTILQILRLLNSSAK